MASEDVCVQLFDNRGEKYGDRIIVSVPSDGSIQCLKEAVIEYANLNIRPVHLAARKSIEDDNINPRTQVADLVQELGRGGVTDVIIALFMLREGINYN